MLLHAPPHVRPPELSCAATRVAMCHRQLPHVATRNHQNTSKKANGFKSSTNLVRSHRGDTANCLRAKWAATHLLLLKQAPSCLLFLAFLVSHTKGCESSSSMPQEQSGAGLIAWWIFFLLLSWYVFLHADRKSQLPTLVIFTPNHTKFVQLLRFGRGKPPLFLLQVVVRNMLHRSFGFLIFFVFTHSLI